MCAAVDQYHNLLEQRNRAEPCAIKGALGPGRVSAPRIRKRAQSKDVQRCLPSRSHSTHDLRCILCSHAEDSRRLPRHTRCTVADKLAETKRAEREARLAAQHEQQAAKEKREAQRLAEAATARDLRAYHGNSKRHQKEIKEVHTTVVLVCSTYDDVAGPHEAV